MELIKYAKLALYCEGIRVTPEAKKQIPEICNGDRVTTNGIQTKFWIKNQEDEPQWVTIQEKSQSKHVMDYKNGKFIIVVNYNEFECYIYPNKEFGGVTWQHTDRIRISPIKGCDCVCAYCNEYKRSYELRKIDVILESVSDALNWKNPPRHCLISGGTPKKEHCEEFDELLIEISNSLPIPVELMIGARQDPSFLQKLYKYGNFSGIKINLEFFDDEDSPIWQKLIPSKHQLGLKTRLDNIKFARSLWQDVEVSSLIIVGLDLVPVQYVKRGIEWIASTGVSPVLSPFIPGADTPLSQHKTPTVAQLIDIYRYAQDIAQKYGVSLGPKCGPCQHNTLTFS